MPKGSDLLVAALENEGVRRIFGVPGEENLDVVESLRTSSIELVVTRHEQPAAFMAATHGRLTGRPGVCLSTLGPGALNLTTGAAFAHLGAMPMLMITGQKPIRSAKQGRFQIVDIVTTMRPLTKSSRQIVSAASIPTLVREAFRLAVEENPGPVHLELPEDIAAEEADVAIVPAIEKADGTGNISYDGVNHERMTELREAKIAGIADELPALVVDADPDATLLVLGWGSSEGAIRAGVGMARLDGLRVARAHLEHLNPWPSNLGDVLRSFDRVLVPEMNTGQLALLLRAKFLVDVESFTKVKGQPLFAAEVKQQIEDRVGSAGTSSGALLADGHLAGADR